MADNYLEKRYDEVFGTGGRRSPAYHHKSLDVLLEGNRSFRGYDKGHVVLLRQLELIIDVNRKVASSVNMQRLRFHPVVKGPEADIVLRHIRLGRGLPELHLPFPGTEPEAFILVASSAAETPGLDIDLGISLQSMLLKAVDLGLGGIIIRNFDREELKGELALPMDLLAVVAIGKPAETVRLVPVRDGESLNYYREGGVHFVPKIVTEDLIF